MRSPVPARYAVLVIALAEMFGTSLWFSVNAVGDALRTAWSLQTEDLGHLTSAIQFGFICGTFGFAFSGLADRFSASRVFAVCAVLGALSNLGFATSHGDLLPALLWRFVTGVMLAGIYPIGMKLVISWQPDRAGEMLGWLVGMLVLGTGLPQLVRASGLASDWQSVFLAASGLSLLAAIMVALLGDGPHHAVRRSLRLGAVMQSFRRPVFRAAALGYFGHMWELYTVWAFIPLLLSHYAHTSNRALNVSGWSFVVIAIGSLGCIIGGLLSKKFGIAKVAFFQLLSSGICCLLTPHLINTCSLFQSGPNSITPPARLETCFSVSAQNKIGDRT